MRTRDGRPVAEGSRKRIDDFQTKKHTREKSYEAYKFASLYEKGSLFGSVL